MVCTVKLTLKFIYQVLFPIVMGTINLLNPSQDWNILNFKEGTLLGN